MYMIGKPYLWVNIKKLKKAGVATRDIAAMTGHKSKESLRDYDDNDISEHMQLSKKISYPTAATASNPSCSHPIPPTYHTIITLKLLIITHGHQCTLLIRGW